MARGGAYEVMACEACDVKRVVVLLVHSLNIDAEAEKRPNLVKELGLKLKRGCVNPDRPRR